MVWLLSACSYCMHSIFVKFVVYIFENSLIGLGVHAHFNVGILSGRIISAFRYIFLLGGLIMEHTKIQMLLSQKQLVLVAQMWVKKVIQYISCNSYQYKCQFSPRKQIISAKWDTAWLFCRQAIKWLVN